MKIENLLYEIMGEITEKEAVWLENGMEEAQKQKRQIQRKRLKVQEKLAMDKIHTEMKQTDSVDEKGSSLIHLSKKKIVLWVAVLVMMIGMVGFAKEYDWDIEMAEMLGLSGVMKELEGGYVEVDVSVTSEGVTVTASQLIGDKNNMWLQLDTNVPWNVEEGYYYMWGDNLQVKCYYRDKELTGGQTFYSFNHNGYVSFMWHFQGYDNINRATICIQAEELLEYQPAENEKDEEICKVISEGTWKLEWENHYAPNTITRHPFKKVECKAGNEEMECIIHEVEVSPVSIKIKGWKSPTVDVFEGDFALLEAVKLKDGTVIPCESSQRGMSNFKVEEYLSIDYAMEIDMSEMEYVTIGGEDIRIAK